MDKEKLKEIIYSDKVGVRELKICGESFSATRYGFAPTRKMNKKLYKTDMSTAHAGGQIMVCKILLARYDDGAYKDLDELIGDIEAILHFTHEHYRLKLANGKIAKSDFDNFVNERHAKKESANGN